MIFRHVLLLMSALMLSHFADSTAICEDQFKKAEAPTKSSLEFKGKGQVIIPKLRYNGRHPITLEAWVKPEARDDNNIRASVVANLQLAGVGIHLSGDRWLFHVNDGHKSNYGYVSIGANEKTEFDKLIHIAAVFDGKNVRLYIDGKQQDSIKQTTLEHVASPHDFMIGADPDGKGLSHQFFNGVIDEVRISKVARYTEDFEPASRFKPDKDTLVLYHFDEGEGNVAHVESDNKYHGAIKGADWVKQID